MKKHPPRKIEKYRIRKGQYASDVTYGNNGMFEMPTSKGVLLVMVSDQLLWDHASVSLKDRIPTWKEMCYIKDLFWEPEETVVQYHPAESVYICQHPFVLHLWRPQKVHVPMPPTNFV
jgi:hypothetical protein